MHNMQVFLDVGSAVNTQSGMNIFLCVYEIVKIKPEYIFRKYIFRR